MDREYSEYKGRAFFCYRFTRGLSERGYGARAEVRIVRVHGEGPRVVYAEFWDSESREERLENIRMGKRAFEKAFFQRMKVHELGWNEFDEIVERGAPGMPEELHAEMMCARDEHEREIAAGGVLATNE